jgi:hypothetical protein
MRRDRAQAAGMSLDPALSSGHDPNPSAEEPPPRLSPYQNSTQRPIYGMIPRNRII